MADIIKTFYAYGKYFEEHLLQSFNQINSKKIDKILEIDLSDYHYALKDKSQLENRLVLYVTSTAGGNLFPFIYISDKLFGVKKKGKRTKSAIEKSFANMKKYLTEDETKEVDEIFRNIDCQKLYRIVTNVEKLKQHRKDAYYLALSYNGKFFNEMYPEVFAKMIERKGSNVSVDGYCFVDSEYTKIGFDVGLNFCSTNEMSDAMGKAIKPKLLPICKTAGQFVKLGFEKIFQDFNFKLFGLNYILLPTVFNPKLEREVFDLINEAKKNDYAQRALQERVILEEDLEEIVEEIEGKKLTNSLLFTMLFYQKNNKEIIVSHTIEDIVPSRIALAEKTMRKYDIDASKLSKYEKVTIKKQNPQLVYIRDYIDDRLYLAKLLFGKEKIEQDALYRILFRKIFYGNNSDNDKREFSLILQGRFKDDTDFTKHQKLLRFLSDERLHIGPYIELGGDMQFDNVEDLVEWKFANVHLLQDEKSIARKFYILGLLASLIVRAQKNKNRDNEFRSSLEDFLNSIGLVTTLNIDQVFNEINKGYKKYHDTVDTYYHKDYEYLMKIWSDAVSLQQNRKLPADKANILFVMGFTDYKNISKKGDKNDG